MLDKLFTRKKEPIPSAEEMKDLMESGRKAQEKAENEHWENIYTNSLETLNRLLGEAAGYGNNELEMTVSFRPHSNYKRFEDYVTSQGYKIEIQYKGLSNTYKISW